MLGQLTSKLLFPSFSAAATAATATGNTNAIGGKEESGNSRKELEEEEKKKKELHIRTLKGAVAGKRSNCKNCNVARGGTGVVAGKEEAEEEDEDEESFHSCHSSASISEAGNESPESGSNSIGERDSNETLLASGCHGDSSSPLDRDDDFELLPTVEPVIHWQARQQRGYKYTLPVSNNNNFGITISNGGGIKEKNALHGRIEDVHFPVNNNHPSESSSTSNTATPPTEYTSRWGDVFFFLADGHAGHEAPHFFIAGLQSQVSELLNNGVALDSSPPPSSTWNDMYDDEENEKGRRRRWNFGDLKDQMELREELTQIYLALDAEYTMIKTREYQGWVRDGSPVNQKPTDDGCTMVLNIIQPGWILNCNVGDSRSVLARPCLYGKEWTAAFSSSDHNMMHPEKVYSMHKNGGKFLDAYGSTILNVKVQHPQDRGDRHYEELANSRLFRPISSEIRAVGCSHRRTLNLSGTMGDLLFKIHPPVLTCAPDISFVPLAADSEYILIMATDGLWDHMVLNNAAAQNAQVIDKVSSLLGDFFDAGDDSSSSMNQEDEDDANSLVVDDEIPLEYPNKKKRARMDLEVTVGEEAGSEGEEEGEKEDNNWPTSNSLTEALGLICSRLVDREGGDEIFSRNLIRYDDCSVVLIHIIQS